MESGNVRDVFRVVVRGVVKFSQGLEDGHNVGTGLS